MRTSALFILKKKLLAFNNFNPQFGRKRYKILIKVTADFKKKICGKILEFNDSHIEFAEKCITDDFLTDHLTYDENYYIVNNSNNLTIVDEEEYFVNGDEDNGDEDSDTIPELNENTILRSDAEDELDEDNENESNVEQEQEQEYEDQYEVDSVS
jgi:hypothetical protein